MTGVLLSLVALFGWGIADFFVQKAAKKVGVSATLFAGGVFGLVVLAPFVWTGIAPAVRDTGHLLLLLAASGVGIVTALFSLEAYRLGKLAVIEPIMGLELPVTVLLAVAFHGERLGLREFMLLIVIFVGLVLTVWRRKKPGERFGAKTFERGVLFGVVGAVCLGASNVLTGVASQTVSPLMAVWFSRLAFSLVFGAHLLVTRRMTGTLAALKTHAAMVFGLSSLYLVTFVSYSVAVTLIPISIATAISENYIVVAALLGVFANGERLARHQAAGIAVSAAGVTALAYLSS